jgi:hypothetical protein
VSNARILDNPDRNFSADPVMRPRLRFCAGCLNAAKWPPTRRGHQGTLQGHRPGGVQSSEAWVVNRCRQLVACVLCPDPTNRERVGAIPPADTSTRTNKLCRRQLADCVSRPSAPSLIFASSNRARVRRPPRKRASRCLELAQALSNAVVRIGEVWRDAFGSMREAKGIDPSPDCGVSRILGPPIVALMPQSSIFSRCDFNFCSSVTFEPRPDLSPAAAGRALKAGPLRCATSPSLCQVVPGPALRVPPPARNRARPPLLCPRKTARGRNERQMSLLNTQHLIMGGHGKHRLSASSGVVLPATVPAVSR